MKTLNNTATKTKTKANKNTNTSNRNKQKTKQNPKQNKNKTKTKTPRYNSKDKNDTKTTLAFTAPETPQLAGKPTLRVSWRTWALRRARPALVASAILLATFAAWSMGTTSPLSGRRLTSTGCRRPWRRAS